MPISNEPALKSVEIFNQLILLPFDATEEIGRIEWQLRQLRRSSCSDGNSSVALLQALIMQGKAGEAHALAIEIWDKRYLLSDDAIEGFTYMLASLGEFEKSLEIGPDEYDDWSGKLFAPTLLEIGVGLGDLDILSVAIDMLAIDSEFQVELKSLLSSWTEIGLAKYFHEQQSVIRQVMDGKFTEYTTLIQKTEGGGIELCVLYHVRENRLERRSLEELIDESIVNFYAGTDIDDPFYFNAHLNYIVADVTSKWPPKIINAPDPT